VRRELRALDAGVPLSDVQTFDDLIASGVSRQRLGSGLLAGFAALALLLAAVGIYGVVASASGQRAREFGVRVALGARRVDVLGAVLLGAARLAGAGVLAGLAAAVALTRVLSAQLYDVSPVDPAVLGGVSALLGVVALLASALPAWRATRVSPMRVLREE
jgi:putative ABC transport system permease protein